MEPEPPHGLADSSSVEQRLSYKFQRLRERIRSAIASGELIGKLPGERELARRFKVNTKTLSKALTDLAADGLVERNIGLGTFVRGSQPREKVRALYITGPGRCENIPEHLSTDTIELVPQADTAELPPSLLNRYDTIIIASERIPDEVIRDLIVRGKRVIAIGRRPGMFATRTIVLDDPSAAAAVALRLVHRGHRQIMVLGYDTDGEIAASIRTAVADESIHFQFGQLTELSDALSHGVTGIIVMPPIDPKQAIAHASRMGYETPARISVVAVGCHDTPPCSGQFIDSKLAATALTNLLEQTANSRPVTVWLSSTFVDTGTLGPAPAGA